MGKTRSKRWPHRQICSARDRQECRSSEEKFRVHCTRLFFFKTRAMGSLTVSNERLNFRASWTSRISRWHPLCLGHFSRRPSRRWETHNNPIQPRVEVKTCTVEGCRVCVNPVAAIHKRRDHILAVGLGPCATVPLRSTCQALDTCGPRPICVDQSRQKHYVRVARGKYVMDEPRTPIFSTDRTPKPDTRLLNAGSVLESTPQKRRFPLTRRASTRSNTPSVVRREMHVPTDNASGTWQPLWIILMELFAHMAH